VPPSVPTATTHMKWYRSKLAENNAMVIEHLFSCSSCHQIAFVSTVRKVLRVPPDEPASRVVWLSKAAPGS
jgi:hypothetical protein